MHHLRPVALAVAALASLAAPAIGQVYTVPPVFAGEPVLGNEPGLGSALPGATPQEYSAALIWGLRSGLNVAALQCSHSAFYDTTGNYNMLLANHRAELAAAYASITGYFARTNGGAVSGSKVTITRAGMAGLNQYDTRSYNGWSTLYAQRGFCHQAAQVGKEARFVPIGGLLSFAQTNMRSLRNSLIFVGDPLYGQRYLYIPLPEIRYPDNCYDKRGAVKEKCLR
ncbi:hypothetical protein [Sphingomonas sp. RB1R13]|uniref:hypothetical protein n=1 Tax=Sphingomonas sp. RB1R13 TaxID=3096159 RepID=UPI002FCAB7A3